MSHLHWFLHSIGGFLLIYAVAVKAQNEIDLENHLQPLHVGQNPQYDELIDDDMLCSRNCTKYPESRICYYKLIAEQYHAMGPACKNCSSNLDDCCSPQCITADGVERTVLVFNRMLPGPAFHVCSGDRIVVDLKNSMPAREISIHWHGQLQQASPWEDGVPYVTQCPIVSNDMFRYDFNANTIGTHFYHSHSGLQLFDGLSGPFIVRTSQEADPVGSLYDYDLFSHTIQIHDWFHEIMDVKYPGYNKASGMIGHIPDSYLINGKGSYYDSTSNQSTNTPLAEFNVQPNKRYRFRIITDTPSTCSLQFTIENHLMLLISADGQPVQPVIVSTLYLVGADIYDVVVRTDQPARPYWIRVQGYGGECSDAEQSALLMYEGTSGGSLPPTSSTQALFCATPKSPELNNVREPCQNNSANVCLDEIKSLYRASDRLLQTPDQRLILEAGTYQYSVHELFKTNSYHRFYLPVSGYSRSDNSLGGMYEDTINNKSNMFTPFTLLADPSNPLINRMVCPDQCPKHCECLNLIKLGYNNVVELVIIDKYSSSALIRDHPFHIHGHHWSIMKLGSLEELITFDAEYNFAIDTTNKYPLIRHSVPIPAQGFAIVRFIADNPGFWLLHCHFSMHNDNGMQVVLQVGEPEKFPQLPENWPKCGNYLPPVY